MKIIKGIGRFDKQMSVYTLKTIQFAIIIKLDKWHEGG